ncbi:MAG: hypothetical protein ACLFQK_01985 [Fibrobacterota bacterium]
MFQKSIILFLSVFISVVMSAETGTIKVESEGYGPSKSDALLEAKREAVEKGIGTVLISQTEIKNFELNKDVILTETKGSVLDYEILHEEKQTDGTFYVKINADVSLASIKKDLAALKILLESMDKPRMMVVISEENGDNAQNMIVDYLSSKSFDLVDAGVVAALMQNDDELIKKATEGDAAAASKIGAQNGAEYILVGKVNGSLGSNPYLQNSQMKSGQASITAKVINCSNARIIASKSTDGAAVHISDQVAIARASKKASEKLMDEQLFEQIVSSWQDMLNNGMSLSLTVVNVSDFRTQKAVQDVIKEFPDIVSMNKRGFGGGKLLLNILFKGTPDSFAEYADGKDVGGLKMAVTGMKGSRIKIDLIGVE